MVPCLVTTGLWARSHSVADMLYLVDNRGHRVAVAISQGDMLFELTRTQPTQRQFKYTAFRPPTDLYDFVFTFMSPDYRGHGGLGFYFLTTSSGWGLLVPMWFIAIASAILPVLWLHRRRKRKLIGVHCGRCGYDLTGNTNGVCPECGTAVVMADLDLL
jgi:ribosomal protein S27AE